MINWQVINDTAKAAGTTPTWVVQNWIDQINKANEAKAKIKATWDAYRATSTVKMSDLSQFIVFEKGIGQGFDLDAIKAQRSDAEYDWACEQDVMLLDRERIESEARPFWQALLNAGLLNVAETDSDFGGVYISPDAYDIAAGTRTQTGQPELFADYDLTEEDLSKRGL